MPFAIPSCILEQSLRRIFYLLRDPVETLVEHRTDRLGRHLGIYMIHSLGEQTASPTLHILIRRNHCKRRCIDSWPDEDNSVAILAKGVDEPGIDLTIHAWSAAY